MFRVKGKPRGMTPHELFFEKIIDCLNQISWDLHKIEERLERIESKDYRTERGMGGGIKCQ